MTFMRHMCVCHSETQWPQVIKAQLQTCRSVCMGSCSGELLQQFLGAAMTGIWTKKHGGFCQQQGQDLQYPAIKCYKITQGLILGSQNWSFFFNFIAHYTRYLSHFDTEMSRRCCLRALLQHRRGPVQHSSQLPSLQQDAGAVAVTAVTATASKGATVKRGMAVETHGWGNGGTGLVKSGMIQGEIGWNWMKWVEMSKCWWGYWGYYDWSFKEHLKGPITNQMFFGSVYFACCECLVWEESPSCPLGNPPLQRRILHSGCANQYGKHGGPLAFQNRWINCLTGKNCRN